MYNQARLSPSIIIFKAAGAAARRELGTFRSLKVNNFFLVILLFVFSNLQSGLEPKSAEFFILLLGLFLLFPLSSDPLALIPASRLASWPLTSNQLRALRLASVLLSPVLWIAIVVLAFTGRYRLAVIWLVMAAAVSLVKLPSRWIGSTPLRFIPQFPGPLGGLIRHDLREMLNVLDPYVASVFCIGGLLYRIFSSHVDPQASIILAILIGIVLSTYAQCLFGLDVSGSAMTRYRLLPLRGWQILVAKDLAYFAVLIPLILPFHWIAGLTFGFVSLAIGHHPSVLVRASIFRWRFAGSRLFPGVVQAVVAIAMSISAARDNLTYFAVAVALYLASLAVYGRLLESRTSTVENALVPVENRL